MALTTAAEARALLPSLTGTGEDTLLDTLIARVGAAFARRCGFPPVSAGASPTMESASYTLEHDGCGGRDLALRVHPATAITAVYDDPTRDFAEDTYLVSADDYAIVHQGRTLRLKSTATHGAWGRGEGRIRVAFTAGYATAPQDLKMLVAQAVHHWFDQRKTQGKTNVSQDGQSVTYDDSAFLPEWIATPLVAGFGLGGAWS